MRNKLIGEELLEYFQENTRADLTNYDRYELLDGTKLSSPNQILKPLTFEKYKDIPHFVLTLAAQNGTYIHQALANLMEDKEAEEVIPPKWIKVAEEIKNVFKENNFEVLASELPIINIKSKYYGFVDYLINKNNKPAVLELKTRSNLKSEDNWLIERFQLYLYQLAIAKKENQRIKGYLLIINRNNPKKYKLIKNSLNEKELALLKTLFRLYRLKKEVKIA